MPARPRAGNVVLVAVPACGNESWPSRQSGNRGSRLPPLPRPGAPPVPGSPLLGAPRYWSDSYESYEPAKAADPHDAATRPCNGNSRRAPEEPGCSRCTAAGAPRIHDAALATRCGCQSPPHLDHFILHRSVAARTRRSGSAITSRRHSSRRSHGPARYALRVRPLRAAATQRADTTIQNTVA